MEKIVNSFIRLQNTRHEQLHELQISVCCSSVFIVDSIISHLQKTHTKGNKIKMVIFEMLSLSFVAVTIYSSVKPSDVRNQASINIFCVCVCVCVCAAHIVWWCINLISPHHISDSHFASICHIWLMVFIRFNRLILYVLYVY